MKQREVLRKLRLAAKQNDLDFTVVHLTNHLGVTIGSTRSTLGRHSEIPDTIAKVFWDQFADELGKGWWR
jgi:hypothetical protein